MATDPLHKSTKDLIIPLIPPDAEDRVTRAFKQSNQVIREQIRNATGLKLSDADTARAIPVKIVEGFPLKFAQLIDRNADPVL